MPEQGIVILRKRDRIEMVLSSFRTEPKIGGKLGSAFAEFDINASSTVEI